MVLRGRVVSVAVPTILIAVLAASEEPMDSIVVPALLGVPVALIVALAILVGRTALVAGQVDLVDKDWGVLHQHRFNGRGMDFEAAPNDDAIGASMEIKKAIAIKPPQIRGPDPVWPESIDLNLDNADAVIA